MEPVTQGALGAAVTLAALMKHTPLAARRLALMGAIGGMAPDLDVLIRSSDDPLLAIFFHRHFTHSLAFIPVGGVVSALPWLVWRRNRAQWRWIALATTLGYATHALLDACTTYGTLLFWPLSMTRVSFSVISVVDPAFTLPLLAAIWITLKRQVPRYCRMGLVYCTAYLALGTFQHQRALDVQRSAASERGHTIERGAVFVTFLNNVAWRSLYSSDGYYYVDKIRVTWTGKSCLTPGTRVQALPGANLGDGVHPSARRAHRLFRWFSDGWVALDPSDQDVIADLRYSASPAEVQPIWGVRIDDSTGSVHWVNNRAKRDMSWSHFETLLGEDGPQHRCY